MYFQKYFNMNHNKGPDHGDSMVNTEEALKYWNFREAKETVRTLVAAYGEPTSMSICDAEWNYVGGLNVCVKDESVPHGDHKDFVYGYKQIAVTPDLYTPLALASESIIIDGQKGIVIARCNSVAVVAIMLGFVEDVTSGAAKPTAEELMGRIENAIIPSWFEDKMGEIVNEGWKEPEGKMAGWIAMYGGKKLEIKKSEAKDLYGAKQLAIKKLKVPKSKVGLMAIDVAYD